jgi:putative copper resistance protein D
MSLHETIIGVRAVHFAATVMTTGVVFFVAFISAPVSLGAVAPRVAESFRFRLAAIAWIGLALTVVSGAAWLVLTAQSMSERPLVEVLSQGVIWTVLTQTHFGNDWLARLVFAGLLAGTLAQLLQARRNAPRWAAAAAVVLAAALVGSLTWAGHAIGASGFEGIIHPAADVLHLVAAAAWVGTLPLLALLLAAAEGNAASVAMMRAATLRFSTLGIVSVGTLLATGIVNTWYLVGSVPALSGTPYGRLLIVKVAMFFGMLALATVNRFRLTPQMAWDKTAAAALRQLRRNAVLESLLGAGIVLIVAIMGTLPPASHAQHHPAYGAIPIGAAFVHIHTEQGMADVTIMPGRTGPAHATIRLWDADFEPLGAREVTFTLTAPAAGSKPITRVAVQDADGAWKVDRIELSQPGNWMVTVAAVPAPTGRLVLDAPIVIEPER